jgi:hypothetical protein
MKTIYERVAEEDLRLTISDAREHFKGCIPGWQVFCEAHGFIWNNVVRHGLLASELLATEDAMAIGLVEWYYGR